jgi:hypothetical protein
MLWAGYDKEVMDVFPELELLFQEVMRGGSLADRLWQKKYYCSVIWAYHYFYQH